MAMSAKKRVILSRLESSYGTQVPLGGVTGLGIFDAILCSNLTIKPLEGAVVERNVVRPYYGSAGSSRAEAYVSLSFDTELAGGIGAQCIPQWDNLMLSCGFSRLSISAVGTVKSGVVGAGQVAGSTSVQLDSSASSIDSTYNGYTVRVGNQVCGTVTAYDGQAKIATVSTAVTAAQIAGLTVFDLSSGLAQNSGAPISGIVNAAQTAGSLNIVLAASASNLDNYYKGWSIRVGSQLCGTIASYNGTTKLAVLTTAVTAAQVSGTTTYDLVNGPILTGACSAVGSSTSIVLATTASAVDNYYAFCSIKVNTGVPYTGVITSYNGTTKTAIVAGPVPTMTVGTTYEISNVNINTGVISGTVAANQLAGANTAVLVGTNGTDSYYVGYTLRVGAQLTTITAYVGATKTATLADAIILPQTSGLTTFDLCTTDKAAPSQVRLAGTSSFVDDSYVGATITVVTPVNSAVSGAPIIVTESRDIIAYDATSRLATLNTPLNVIPAPSTTYAISAATSYQMNSDVSSVNNSSSTFVYNVDGVSHTLYGARGTFSIDMTAKQFPIMKWTFTGLLGDMAQVAQVMGDFTTWEPPVVVNSNNTNQFLLCDGSPSFSKLSIDIGNTVVHRQVVGAETIVIPDRKPKGSITIDAVNGKLLTNYFAKVKADTAGLFYVRHGAKIGDYVSIWGPVCQIGTPNYGDQDSLVMLDMSLDFQPKLTPALTGGNNELRIICK